MTQYESIYKATDLSESSNPVIAAHLFLAEERERAHAFLREEAERLRHEAAQLPQETTPISADKITTTAYPREAFSLPSFVLEAIFGYIHPSGMPPAQKNAILAQIFNYLDDIGWTVRPASTPEKVERHLQSREPLRQLAGLLDGYGKHHLVKQLVEIIGQVPKWCEHGTFNGEGSPVPYPHIIVELLNIGRK